MEEFKSIFLALGAAFAIALGALLFALLIRKRADAFQEELKLPPEMLKKIYPAWRSWGPLRIGVFLVSLHWFRSGSLTSIDIGGPLMLAFLITGAFSSVYFLREWLKEPGETQVSKLLGRNLAASVVQIALCAVLFGMRWMTHR